MWRKISMWSLSVAESRGVIRWQEYEGQRFVVTRFGRVYRVSFRAGRLFMRPVLPVVG